MGCEYSRKFGIPYSKYLYIIFASENIRDTSKSLKVLLEVLVPQAEAIARTRLWIFFFIIHLGGINFLPTLLAGHWSSSARSP